MRSTQANVMGEQRRPEDVVMAVYGVRAPQDGNTCTAGQGRGVEALRQRQPIPDCRLPVHLRPSTTAVQYRTQRVMLNVPWCDRTDFRLRHLSNFLAQSHARNNGRDAFLIG